MALSLIGYGATRAADVEARHLPESPMIRLDYDALRHAPVAANPYPHIVVRNFVPPESLAQVLPDLPAMPQGGAFPVDGLRLGPHAKALIREIEGPALRKLIADIFGLNLNGAPAMTTLCGLSREKDGRMHTASASRRVTALLFLNPMSAAWANHDGCLRLLRGSDDIEDFAVEVPPVDGTLVVFPNGPRAWHGYKRYVGPRTVLQLNYMARDAAARAELRRHRFSALLNRVTNRLIRPEAKP